MEIQDIKDKIEKAIVAVATADSMREPHNIAVAYVKVEKDKIIITDNFMKTTIENIKNNPRVSLVFWEGEKDSEEGYRINGKAEYHEEGEWRRFVRELKENKDLPAKGAIVIDVEEIRRLA